MAVARSLRRLLRVLTLQEEQAQTAFQNAIAQLRRLESGLEAAVERERRGRRLLVASTHSDEGVDRQAALEESAAGRRAAAAQRPRIAQAGQEAALRREEFMAKRVERRQAETLIQEAEAREDLETSRRSQQVMDDWYLGRLRLSQPVDEDAFSQGWEPDGKLE